MLISINILFVPPLRVSLHLQKKEMLGKNDATELSYTQDKGEERGNDEINMLQGERLVAKLQNGERERGEFLIDTHVYFFPDFLLPRPHDFHMKNITMTRTAGKRVCIKIMMMMPPAHDQNHERVI